METRSAGEQPGTTYLVERYWPGIDKALLLLALDRLERAISDMTQAGSPVSHLGSVLVDDEQVVYSLIRAGSEDLVRDVNERAQLPIERIWKGSLHGFSALVHL
jgi:hypothetical protein